MSGKGDTPRPIPNRKRYEDNWDAIFGKKEQEEELMEFHGIPTKKSIKKLKQKMEMWEHYCTAEASSMMVGKGEECNWCGMTEK